MLYYQQMQTPNIYKKVPQTTVNVVDKMMDLEKLFRLSMDPNSALYPFLAQNPQHRQTMHSISTQLNSYLKRPLEGSVPENEVFLNAFNKISQTKGYSMMVYLTQNRRLGEFLEHNIDKLKAVHDDFIIADLTASFSKLKIG